jgi:hypothetical protein
MSCITQILNLKGEKEFWNIGKIVIEDGGIYKDYEFLITFVNSGFRCGYVAIPENHKLYNLEEHEAYGLDIDVHGGITFFDRHETILERTIGNISCSDKWLGFDAGHYNDDFDEICLIKYFGKHNPLTKLYSDNYRKAYKMELKDKHFMINECKKLIDQIIEINN